MSDQAEQDRTYVERIKKGESTAFRELFNRYYQTLLAVAINLLHDINTAKDVVQEVFFQLWKKRETLTVPRNVEAYLKRATINTALNYIKAKKRTSTLKDSSEIPTQITGAVEQLEADEVQMAIQQALASLPKRCREVFILKRMEGLSLKEIAAKLDISPKTAENQITKALKVLKEVVKPYVKE